MEVRPVWRVGARHADHRRIFIGADSRADRLPWVSLRADASRATRGGRSPHHRALCRLCLARSRYPIASAVYLLMLFVLLPVRHLRYVLSLCLVVGWSVSVYLALFHRSVVRAIALAALASVTVLPSFFLVGALSKGPPPVAGLDWVKANRPNAILYSGSLRRQGNSTGLRARRCRGPRPRPSATNAARTSHRAGRRFRPVPR